MTCSKVNFCTYYFHHTQGLIFWFIFVTEAIKKYPTVELWKHKKNSLMRPLLFCDVMQQWLVVSWQCFRTTYWSHLESTALPLKLGLMGSPEMSVTTNQCYVKSQKSNNLIHTAAEVWNHTENFTNVKNCLLRLQYIYLKECANRYMTATQENWLGL
jgi:hypothetical protein